MRTASARFRGATMMAFLAVVALFVSPLLALGCCCGGASHAVSHAAPPVATSSPVPSCHAPTPDASSIHAASGHTASDKGGTKNGAAWSGICGCEQLASASPFVTSDASRFFALAPVALTSLPFVFYAPVVERPTFFIHAAAQPRSPSVGASFGRAPPALA